MDENRYTNRLELAWEQALKRARAKTKQKGGRRMKWRVYVTIDVEAKTPQDAADVVYEALSGIGEGKITTRKTSVK